MAEARVTKEQVREVLMAFHSKGLPRPGLHRLREHIGHGSLARIRKLVADIEAEAFPMPVEATDSLPAPLGAAVEGMLAAVTRSWQDMEAALEQRRQVLEAHHADATAQYGASLQAAQGALDATQNRVSQLADSLRGREAEIQTLEKDLARRTGELKELRGREADLRERLAQGTQAAQEREQILQTERARDQAQAAATLAQSREDRQVLEQRTEELHAALARTREEGQQRLAQLEASGQLLQEQLRQRELAIAKAGEALRDVESALQSRDLELAEANRTLTASRVQSAALEERCRGLVAQNDTLGRHLTTLQGQIEQERREHERLIGQMESRISQLQARQRNSPSRPPPD